MIRKLRQVTGIAVIFGCFAGHAGAMERATTRSVYDFFVGGIKAGEIRIDARYQNGAYQAQSILRTAGLVGMVYEASFEAEAEGMMTADGLSPSRFSADSRMRSKSQSVEMLYTDAAPREVRAEPAFDPRPWQIDPAAQTGTLDPITAALTALAPMPRGKICNRSVEVFDGRRRYAIDLKSPVVEGGRSKCAALYRRIAGFKPKMMRKGSEFPFHVWFEERGDGMVHMVRAAGESLLGVAVILLRE